MVHSSVHSVFNEASHWVEVDLPGDPSSLRLGLVSRNYPHKNLSILADVKRKLEEKFGRIVEMYVTFSQDEWEECDEFFKSSVINIGPLSLSQCPAFYAAMDGVIFPSLLECFSAVPIESMVMGRPLFASKLPFIEDVCGDHCQYFDPLDSMDIAEVVEAYFSQSTTQRQRFCEGARTHVQCYPSAQQRAKQYLNIIKDMLSSNGRQIL